MRMHSYLKPASGNAKLLLKLLVSQPLVKGTPTLETRLLTYWLSSWMKISVLPVFFLNGPRAASRFQGGETCGAAFYASIDLLAGSGNNAGCNGGKYGGLIMKYARTSFGWFIFTWVSIKFVFDISDKKTNLPLLAERLSCSAYIFRECL